MGLWRHVRSEYNPADYVSRGLAVLDDRFVTWIRGPSFLNGTDSNWQDSIPSMSSNDQLETRRVVLHVDRVAETSLDKLLGHYFEWTKLVRAVAWLNRFTQYYRTMKGKGDTLRIGCLTVSELQNSEGWIIKYVQRRVFSEEYTALKTNSHGFDWRINRLRKLSPELRQGLIVVGGGLQLANRSEESKHQIILPKGHAVTCDLFIKYTFPNPTCLSSQRDLSHTCLPSYTLIHNNLAWTLFSLLLRFSFYCFNYIRSRDLSDYDSYHGLKG